MTEKEIEVAMMRAALRVEAFDFANLPRFVAQVHAVLEVLRDMSERLDVFVKEDKRDAADFCTDQICNVYRRIVWWRDQKSEELFGREARHEVAKVRAALEGLRLDLDWIKSEEEKEDK